jgi:hypothetical protein
VNDFASIGDFATPMTEPRDTDASALPSFFSDGR